MYRVIGETGHSACPYISMVTAPLRDFVPMHQDSLQPFGALAPLRSYATPP